MFSYRPLMSYLKSHGMKKTDLLQITTSATLAKLSADKPVSMQTLDDICSFLHCRIEDIMEHFNDDPLQSS